MVKSYVFRQETDAAARGRVSKFVSQHFTMTAAGKHESDGQMHGGGFTCAVGAEKAEDLAPFDPQGEIAKRRDPLAPEKAAILLADIVERKGRNAGHEWIKDTTGPKEKAFAKAKAFSFPDVIACAGRAARR